MIELKKGLDIPISGSPLQEISSGHSVQTVAILGSDYVGMKPSMLVQVGEQVKKGQPLFEDKKTPGVLFTAPASGMVKEINRGEKRIFQSLVIQVSGNHQVQFKHYKNKSPDTYSENEVRSLLVESGLWTYFRTRPFSKTPALDSIPASIFINVMDTQPLAPSPKIVLQGQEEDFKLGVRILTKLSPVWVVTHKDHQIDLTGIVNVRHEQFAGPHPAGNVGTHIHFLDPVSPSKKVWHINYQDIIAIGHLFRKGELSNKKIISLAGPMAKSPRLIRTIRGANLKDLTMGESKENKVIRMISGSVLGGTTANGPYGYLGQFHSQVTLLEEGHYREFLGWQSPGLDKYSVKNVFLSKLIPKKKFEFDTNTNGSLRSIVPIGSFEKVMPLDILPTQLLRYLMAKNTDMILDLGGLELDEEDLALCTFVDPCKNEYGPILRENLTLIEKEGF